MFSGCEPVFQPLLWGFLEDPLCASSGLLSWDFGFRVLLTLKRVLGSRALTSIQRHGLAHSFELIPFFTDMPSALCAC